MHKIAGIKDKGWKHAGNREVQGRNREVDSRTYPVECYPVPRGTTCSPNIKVRDSQWSHSWNYQKIGAFP